MFDWLFEGRLSVTLLLAAALAVLLWLWWRRRERFLLLAAGAVLLLLVLYHVLDHLVETDREQIRHRVEMMAAAVQTRDLNQMFQYVSDQFRSAGGRNKQELRKLAQDYAQSGVVTGLEVWDIVCEDGISRNRGTARGSFLFKVRSKRDDLQALYFRCDATFDFHPELGWRLRSCRVLDPLHDNVLMPEQP